jgi:hypothetical protein
MPLRCSTLPCLLQGLALVFPCSLLTFYGRVHFRAQKVCHQAAHFLGPPRCRRTVRGTLVVPFSRPPGGTLFGSTLGPPPSTCVLSVAFRPELVLVCGGRPFAPTFCVLFQVVLEDLHLKAVVVVGKSQVGKPQLALTMSRHSRSDVEFNLRAWSRPAEARES